MPRRGRLSTSPAFRTLETLKSNPICRQTRARNFHPWENPSSKKMEPLQSISPSVSFYFFFLLHFLSLQNRKMDQQHWIFRFLMMCMCVMVSSSSCQRSYIDYQNQDGKNMSVSFIEADFVNRQVGILNPPTSVWFHTVALILL